MNEKAIVLDANILIRAVLGRKVRELILDYAATTRFHAPDVAYADARHYLPELLLRRGIDPGPAMVVLDRLESIVRPLDAGVHAGVRYEASRRIAARDADDWPVLACAMIIGVPSVNGGY